jgi:hypothetical protein
MNLPLLCTPTCYHVVAVATSGSPSECRRLCPCCCRVVSGLLASDSPEERESTPLDLLQYPRLCQVAFERYHDQLPLQLPPSVTRLEIG